MPVASVRCWSDYNLLSNCCNFRARANVLLATEYRVDTTSSCFRSNKITCALLIKAVLLSTTEIVRSEMCLQSYRTSFIDAITVWIFSPLLLTTAFIGCSSSHVLIAPSLSPTESYLTQSCCFESMMNNCFYKMGDLSVC